MATTSTLALLAPLLLNWPFLGFVLLIGFLLCFRAEIGNLLTNSALPGVNNSQVAKNTISSVSATPDANIEDNFRFEIFSRDLVLSTVTNLFTLYRKTSLSEQEFRDSMIISPETKKADIEKTAQLQILFKFGLIEELSGNVLKVTKLGKEFLKYKGYVI